MKKVFFTAIGLLAVCFVKAQTQFITSGKIEFERRTNVHRLFFADEEGGSFYEMIKKSIPQFRNDYFDLFFTEKKSVFKPGKDSDIPKRIGFFGQPPGFENNVYMDLETNTGISQKQIYEQSFLITDSLKKLEWKITSETRTIAGFECRKALTKICDSVVVVAFYTEEIVPSAGPESFHGLPGMILGLAIPRLYTTWFATKLELTGATDEKKISPPLKGKKATNKEMITSVNNGIKNWGDKYRDKAIWLSSL